MPKVVPNLSLWCDKSKVEITGSLIVCLFRNWFT
ncbi:hypothetical protein TcasGA2_TC034638 [Tribolium castaneum]|uniref:Uncharacterized protein n=1 Tax=Tribolium castaneum TaxID=7070 RepID=A0A139WJV2_TRICA|nr:hypothetical protein TcasGA2_TC034638 [Tribolium castaneum]